MGPQTRSMNPPSPLGSQFHDDGSTRAATAQMSTKAIRRQIQR